jgi:hypothetical protein
MIVELLNKGLVVLYILSTLLILRHAYYFFQTLLTTTEEDPKKYKLSKTSLFFLGLSIAYVLSAIFTGIKI